MRINLRAILLASLATLTVAILATSGLLLVGTNRQIDDLHSVYVDRVIPMRDLRIVSDSYAVTLIDQVVKASIGRQPAATSLTVIKEALAQAEERWRAYEETKLLGREIAMAAEVKRLRMAAAPVIQQTMAALEQGDRAALSGLLARDLYGHIDPLTDSLDHLIGIQAEITEQVYGQSKEFGQFLLAMETALSLFGILAIGVSLWAVVMRIVRPLTAMTVAMQRPAANDLETDVPGIGRPDEIGAMGVFKHNVLNRRRLEADRIAALMVEFERQAGTVTNEVAHSAEVMQSSATGLAEIATSEISRNVQEASAGTTEIARSVAGVQSIAFKTGDASDHVLDIPSSLTAQARRLSAHVSEFLHGERAA